MRVGGAIPRRVGPTSGTLFLLQSESRHRTVRDSGARFVKSARLPDRSVDLVWIGLDPEVRFRISDLRRLLSYPGLGAESAERLPASGSVISWPVDRVRIRIFPNFFSFLPFNEGSGSQSPKPLRALESLGGRT